jgi:ribosome-associated protein
VHLRRATLEDDVLFQSEKSAAFPAAGRVPMTAAPTAITSDVLLARILASLDDDKAEDVVTIDLRGRSSVADHMVICSGRSSRQVAAIAEKLVERLKAEFGRTPKVEGKDQGDWVLIDAADVVVHVFRPEVREFYQLEKMWMPTGAALATRQN